MASSKYLELQNLSDTELQDELKATEEGYQKMKFDHAITGMDNPLRLREIRRDVARLKTETRSRQLTAASVEELENRSKIRARRRRN